MHGGGNITKSGREPARTRAIGWQSRSPLSLGPLVADAERAQARAACPERLPVDVTPRECARGTVERAIVLVGVVRKEK